MKFDHFKKDIFIPFQISAGTALLLFVFNFSGISDVYAQSPTIIPETMKEIHLDGILGEDAWQDAVTFRLVMHSPGNGEEASEPTTVYLMYDDRYLYVAGNMSDSEPEKIQAPTKKRDEMGLNSDWFGIFLDTFNDKENGLTFLTTPSGLRTDFHIYNDGQGDFPVNRDWNTFWDVEVNQNDRGWTVEMRIPVSSLRFQDSKGKTTMGLSIIRYIARKSEWDSYPNISDQWGFWSPFKPSQFLEITFENLSNRKPLYIAPYLLGGVTQRNILNNQETEYELENTTTLEPGLDVKFGLTSNLTADVTINTDFAQVEADNQQVNLTRFSLFFPEKRLFFLERSSTFDFGFGGPDRLFYSRRIGIHNGEPSRIYGGARVVGRTGPWDLGFLSMQTEAAQGVSSKNNSVLRLRRQIINENTYVGGMMTSLIGTDGSQNIAYGIDGVFKLFDQSYLTTAWAQTFDDEKNSELLSTDPSRLRINFENRDFAGFTYDLSYSYSGESYNPGLGFQNRSNFTRFGNSLGIGWIPDHHSFINRHKISANGFLILSNETGTTESLEIGPEYNLNTLKSANVTIDFKYQYEDVPQTFDLSNEVEVPAGAYDFFGSNFSFETSNSRLLTATFSGYTGTFFDGWRHTLGISPNWSVSPSLNLSGLYQINYVTFPDRNQLLTASVARLRMLYMFNIAFSVSAFTQYNSLSNGIISNLRIRYNPSEGNDLYIVFNETFNTNRSRMNPVLPITDNRTILLKYTYTFNY
ncbi:MAG: carbohydrate binding family 9 domain-containing protein [Gracilimonas sp.]|uniref:DUF5916 domain-containing protein n=1 Tax=Gracilimonas sp. TaxID=1974203 RepID=UPI00198E81FB|nr:DUF5916 domain-containing protein [Gracilimonas sp.]MBD3616894.1 carbohydrate binding family 9 domain-containing protein [Gracilimonas sp.]